MSKNLSKAAVDEFIGEIKDEYQQEDEMLVTSAIAAGAFFKQAKNTKSVSIPSMKRGFMKDRGAASSTITPANFDYSRKEITFKERVILEYTDIFRNDDVDFDEQTELARNFGFILAQDKDQGVIEAFQDGTYVNSPDLKAGQSLLVDDGGTPAVFTLNKMKKVAAFFTANAVPQAGRVWVMDAYSHAQLLSDTEATSGDYQVHKVLSDTGVITNILGFKVVVIADGYDDEGTKRLGLPETGNVRSNYAFHGKSMAIAYGDIVDSISTQWHNEKLSHSLTASLKRGAIIRDNVGVVEIQNDVTNVIV